MGRPVPGRPPARPGIRSRGDRQDHREAAEHDQGLEPRILEWRRPQPHADDVYAGEEEEARSARADAALEGDRARAEGGRIPGRRLDEPDGVRLHIETMGRRIPPWPRQEAAPSAGVQRAVPPGKASPCRRRRAGAMAREDLPPHQKKARAEGAAVLFEDEVWFQQEGTTRQSWARRGKGVTVYRHPGKRKSGFYGAVSIGEEPGFVFQKAETFNAKTFQAFLELVLASFDRVFLIIDNVGYHRAKALRPFLGSNRHRLRLRRLPPYSPELNAAEMVWRETRRDATHNRYFPTQRGLTRAVQTQFRTYQAEPRQLRGIVAPFL